MKATYPKPWLYRVFRAVLRTLCQILFRVEVQHSSTPIPQERLLIIANHQSFLDGLLLGLFLPLDPVFVINTAIAQQRVFRFLLLFVDHVTVDTSSPMAMKRVINLIEQGRPVVIFPEGRITITGSLMKVYEGTAFVAAKTGAAILPVSLQGPSHSYFSRMAAWYPHRLFPKICLTLHPVCHITMPEARTAKERRRLAGRQMVRIMQEMLFAEKKPLTLFDALCAAARLHGKKKVLVEDISRKPYTYADLMKMALVLGRVLERHTNPGEYVGLLLPNMAVSLALFFGLSARGRVPAMLNYTSGSAGLQSACTAADIKTIISSRAFVDQANLSKKIEPLYGQRIIYLENLRQEISLVDKIWYLFYARHCYCFFSLNHDPEQAAVVLFTSGSEGAAKGVVLSHRAIMANISQICAVIDFSCRDKVLNALPMFHSFGLTAGTLLPVITGAGLILYPTPLHYRIIPELVYDRNCTILFGTSTFLGHYSRFAHSYDFHTLRYVVAGAEKLAQPVKEAWMEKFGLRIFEGYGATETAPVLAVNTPMAFRSGSVGNLLPGIKAAIENIPGIERGGVLHVRGANVMSGYLREEKPGQLEPPESSMGKGWYNTGDVVEQDEEGFLYVVGRVKRFAKIAGEMIGLETVEKIIAQAAPQFSHAVVARQDASKGEGLLLFTTDPQIDRGFLIKTFKAAGLQELAVPRRIVNSESLPLLGTGKTDYPALQKLAEEL
ncbi:MAG: bifunctional acyl-ACP--phospholipid O-acyltransferase/long-chain-fatty-acid--ACP ligase [Desulfobulbaceae bacterium]|nr:bifunctional acyl-ACP--phospholipid O-acyltransferase/long-chain-fatty-acid--ACP ligase [Desulfobulbaceae bacterium]